MEPSEVDLGWCYKLKEPSLVPRLPRYSLSVECIVGNVQNIAFWFYFDYVMVTWKRYQALPAIDIHVLERGHTNMEHMFINQFLWTKQDTLHIYAVYKMPMQIYTCIVFILSGRTGSLDGPDQH